MNWWVVFGSKPGSLCVCEICDYILTCLQRENRKLNIFVMIVHIRIVFIPVIRLPVDFEYPCYVVFLYQCIINVLS